MKPSPLGASGMTPTAFRGSSSLDSKRLEKQKDHTVYIDIISILLIIYKYYIIIVYY